MTRRLILPILIAAFGLSTVFAQSPAPPPRVIAQAQDVEIVFWQSIVNSTDPADFRAYLAKFPNGHFGELAKNRLARLADARPAPPAPPTPPSPQRVDPPAPGPPAKPSTPTLAGAPREQMTTLIQFYAPAIAQDRRTSLLNAYFSANGSKAIAFLPGGDTLWPAYGRASDVIARGAALEGCQIVAGKPCALIAVNEALESLPADGPATRAMPNFANPGRFDPILLPIDAAEFLKQPQVRDYLRSPDFKAIALHPVGRMNVVSGAPSTQSAEDNALAACNLEAVRNALPGPCYLYASGPLTVLRQRAVKARPIPANLQDAFNYWNLTEDYLRAYLQGDAPSAIAIEPFSRRMQRVFRAPNQQRADEAAMELCQMSWGVPCVLLASARDLRAPDILRPPQQISLPRLSWAGAYDPANIPGFLDPNRREFVAYKEMPAPKAMVVRGFGPKVTISSGKDEMEAQIKALAACNDPDPVLPCFIYAINDRVVFSQRKPEPIK